MSNEKNQSNNLFCNSERHLNSIKLIDLSGSGCKGKVTLGGDHGVTLTKCFAEYEETNGNIIQYLEGLFWKIILALRQAHNLKVVPYDRIVAIVNNMRVRNQEEKNKTFIIY